MAKGRLGPAVIAQGNQASVTIQETDRMAMVAMTWQQRLSATTASKWTILVRLLVGLVVFFPEGIQKLAFPEILGAGRFANIGIPFPEITGPFVGIVETVSGALIIVGLFTRLAAIPLIIIMIVAILSTKVPILLGHEFWIFHLPKLPRYGFWSMMHEARADFTMLLGSIYLLIEGAGMWSIDSRLEVAGQIRTGR
jgi:putative oxidoreductase